MRLSEIDSTDLNDQDISSIVYSDIEDAGVVCKYGLVFGNSMLINERVEAAVKSYKDKRIEKMIFMGGIGGISNEEKSDVSEAEKMKALAICLGVNENDILIDDASNNTFENVDNALELLGREVDNLKNIIVITSQFHLKRCYAILKKKLPNLEVCMISAKDGFTDADNWFLSDNSWNSGRSLATYEARLLIKYAKEQKIADLEVDMNSKRCI